MLTNTPWPDQYHDAEMGPDAELESTLSALNSSFFSSPLASSSNVFNSSGNSTVYVMLFTVYCLALAILRRSLRPLSNFSIMSTVKVG